MVAAETSLFTRQTERETMASDLDACVPAVVTDFIFDLADSVTLSQLPEEQTKLYNVIFRELCNKVSIPMN
jgi:hypothetical protein